MHKKVEINKKKDIVLCVSAESEWYQTYNLKEYMSNLFFEYRSKKIKIFSSCESIAAYITMAEDKNCIYVIWLMQEEDNAIGLMKKLRKKEITNYYILTDEDYNCLL